MYWQCNFFQSLHLSAGQRSTFDLASIETMTTCLILVVFSGKREREEVKNTIRYTLFLGYLGKLISSVEKQLRIWLSICKQIFAWNNFKFLIYWIILFFFFLSLWNNSHSNYSVQAKKKIILPWWCAGILWVTSAIWSLSGGHTMSA